MFHHADDTVAAKGALTITPSDTTELKYVRGLYIGGTGDVAVVCADGSTVTFVAVPAGSLLPVQVVQVLATGTTAGDIVALI